ncbi:MAG: DUF1003 domain-containing protein [Paracoccus sp. (in: a-proteobacteria)]|jgi:uncharacterized membrane protein|uniref:DUF1003 domain-containing protein n=1 Tax=unclassified Paracoccus (in: a-proteobacteria) TaxID=2688777 RepID=UPI000C3543AB|nr:MULTISPECIES: DUF1003 domain-containing protein [unclassified Paracoccus (in: a-proteobacteria)]MBA50152.1 hypothetical protein [Paracoccus sp. (in: a-proteobacteria)]|tara:strand:- start:764 stop:1483 length:720 start_codon:yes stop_codon:yes gene_type:complete
MIDPVSTRTAGKSVCHVCGRSFPAPRLRPWISVRPGVSELIAATAPGWGEGKQICQPDLARFRRDYVERLLADERGELADLDRQVIASLEAGEPVSRNPENEAEDTYTFGERLADGVAEFGGSWTFILSFLAVLIFWMLLNVLFLGARPFDPYPFILLNLVLSCLAALQAPVIMMSQRRQEKKDRLRAENDYRVNLKSELEIRQLHEKIDHQLAQQWEKLVELQQIQIELLEENADGRR